MQDLNFFNFIPRFPLRPSTGAVLAVLLSFGPMLALAQQPAAPPPAVEVTVVAATPQTTPATFEFTGKTESSRSVEIRARVEGYLDKIAYTEGDYVRTGQLLFQLDPQPFQAALDNAKGDLARAEAQLANARATLARVRPLAKEGAVSQKDLDDTVAAELSARAQVQSAQAQVRTAELNLSYTTLKSPMNGLTGKSEFREGSLVSPGPDSLLTTVLQLDPAWINFGIGENELLRLRSEAAAGRLTGPGVDKLEVELVLADGGVFPQKGRITFVSPTVDPQTGAVTLRAEVPNPGPTGRLLPGQFVRVRIEGASRPDTIMVPQRAVMQGPQGKFVYVVGANNQAEVKPVEVGAFYGEQWIINSGLSGGEQVIVDGAIKVRAGSSVQIAPAAPAGQ
ncbi:MAG: efflux RND transporter periplasmic adaptor subunit [Candidatus Competibacteraceae bacterium]|nr:MAG: efflux RND transporter periplasmic adaptor subunit [Candidatus Competibacteraceae bacterium]